MRKRELKEQLDSVVDKILMYKPMKDKKKNSSCLNKRVTMGTKEKQ